MDSVFIWRHKGNRNSAKLLRIFSSNKKDENIISANRAAANEIKVQSAEEDTKIEFTDENLKKYMQENYDKNGDGKITAKDVAEITEIKIPYIKEEAIDLKE